MNDGRGARFLSPRNRVFFCVILLILLAAAYLLGIRRDMTDFGVCYRAGGRILSGETLYRETDQHLQFKYAPAAALLFVPFSALPWEAAKPAWFLVLLACLAGILAVASKGRAGEGRMTPWAIVAAVAVLLKFLGREFELGQVNLLILYFMVLAVREGAAGRERPSGFWWGFSLLFKPYALIFLPYWILKRRWVTIAAGAATLSAGLLAPALFYGWKGNGTVIGEWLRSLAASTPGLLRVGDNASLYALFAKAFGVKSMAGAMAAGGVIAAVLGILMLLMIVRGRKEKITGADFAEASALIMLVPMLSPLGWNYNYLYGLPAVMLLASAFNCFRRVERAILIFDFILIGGAVREVLGRTAFRFYTWNALVVPCFLVLFGLMFVARRRRLM